MTLKISLHDHARPRFVLSFSFYIHMCFVCVYVLFRVCVTHAWDHHQHRHQFCMYNPSFMFQLVVAVNRQMTRPLPLVFLVYYLHSTLLLAKVCVGGGGGDGVRYQHTPTRNNKTSKYRCRRSVWNKINALRTNTTMSYCKYDFYRDLVTQTRPAHAFVQTNWLGNVRNIIVIQCFCLTFLH